MRKLTNKQIDNRIRKLQELEQQKENVEALIKVAKQELQDVLGDDDNLETDNFVLRWTKYVKNTFDTKRFKEDQAALYKAYTIEKNQRRFTIGKPE